MAVFSTKRDAKDNPQRVKKILEPINMFLILLFQNPYSWVYFITYILGEQCMYVICQYTQGLVLGSHLPFCFNERAVEGPSLSTCPFPYPHHSPHSLPWLCSFTHQHCLLPKPTASQTGIFSSSLEALSLLQHLTCLYWWKVQCWSLISQLQAITVEKEPSLDFFPLHYFIFKMRKIFRTSQNCEVQRKL